MFSISVHDNCDFKGPHKKTTVRSVFPSALGCLLRLDHFCVGCFYSQSQIRGEGAS